MKNCNCLLLLLILFLFVQTKTASILAQNVEFSDVNRAIVKHFESKRLNAIATENPEIFEAIKFYFKESFEVEMIDCESCEVDLDEFFNYDLYDMYEHESKRLAEEVHSFEYKEKYRVELLSEGEISADMGGKIPRELLAFIPSRPLPEWESTGNEDKDYETYKTKLRKWSLDFPEKYKELFISGEVKIVSIDNFLAANTSRKNSILNNSGGYIIKD
ncbi:MAG: hypothetical protein WEA99_07460 [Brumimicrobium sp.]